jgi:sugar O-acyltransferase (sialic acid O-acetyltransferase NeuD family)
MAERTKVVGLGAGGHAKVILDILSFYDQFEVVGLTNADPATVGRSVLGVPILGGDDILPRLRAEGVSGAFVGVGSVGDCRLRRKLFDLASSLGFEMIQVIHPDATVARSARMGQGDVVMAGAVLNPDTLLGDNVIVNTAAHVDHDCVLGDHVHVAPGAHLSGGVVVETCAHIGIGATIIQGIRIGAGALVGAGTVVLRDVPPNVTVFGVPARLIERRD